jgi:hypothetical protein
VFFCAPAVPEMDLTTTVVISFDADVSVVSASVVVPPDVVAVFVLVELLVPLELALLEELLP